MNLDQFLWKKDMNKAELSKRLNYKNAQSVTQAMQKESYRFMYRFMIAFPDFFIHYVHDERQYDIWYRSRMS